MSGQCACEDFVLTRRIDHSRLHTDLYCYCLYCCNSDVQAYTHPADAHRVRTGIEASYFKLLVHHMMSLSCDATASWLFRRQHVTSPLI